MAGDPRPGQPARGGPVNSLATLCAQRDIWQDRLDRARKIAAQAEAEIVTCRARLDDAIGEIARLRLDAARELLKTGAPQ